VVMRVEAENGVAQLGIASGESCIGEELLICKLCVTLVCSALGERQQCTQETLAKG